MGGECFPAITKCFSSKNMMKMEVKVASPTTSSSRNKAANQRRGWEEVMREVFGHLDSDSDGKISPSELMAYFASVGEYMSPADAQAVIHHLDSDGDGSLGFQDFLRVMKKGTADDEEEEEDELLMMKKVFEMFEHHKGSGTITPTGLQRMLGRLGHSKSQDDCAAMIHIYDIDGDGQLDFQEFYHMMTS